MEALLDLLGHADADHVRQGLELMRQLGAQEDLRGVEELAAEVRIALGELPEPDKDGVITLTGLRFVPEELASLGVERLSFEDCPELEGIPLIPGLKELSVTTAGELPVSLPDGLEVLWLPNVTRTLHRIPDSVRQLGLGHQSEIPISRGLEVLSLFRTDRPVLPDGLSLTTLEITACRLECWPQDLDVGLLVIRHSILASVPTLPSLTFLQSWGPVSMQAQPSLRRVWITSEAPCEMDWAGMPSLEIVRLSLEGALALGPALLEAHPDSTRSEGSKSTRSSSTYFVGKP